MEMQIHLVCGSKGCIEIYAKSSKRFPCKIGTMLERGLPPVEGQLSPHHLSSTHLPSQQGASKEISQTKVQYGAQNNADDLRMRSILVVVILHCQVEQIRGAQHMRHTGQACHVLPCLRQQL